MLYAQIICRDIDVWCEKSFSLVVVSFSLSVHGLKGVDAADSGVHVPSSVVLTAGMKLQL